MLNKELDLTLNMAFKDARVKRYCEFTTEHLLLALLDNSDARRVLKACSADLERLRSRLNHCIDLEPGAFMSGNYDYEMRYELAVERVLQRAYFHVQAVGKEEVSGADVLAALFSEGKSFAVHFLESEGIARIDVVNFISHDIPKSDQKDESELLSTEEDWECSEESSSTTPLERYAVNLNRLSKAKGIDRVVGRDNEINRVIQILCRRQKNNPILVGEAGVGKTAIAKELANLIVEGNVSSAIQNSEIYALDLGALVAGTQYRGDFEKRLNTLLKELKRKKNAILFIDEIHTIIGAGSSSRQAMDAANLMKPALASGELKCIGATTFQEYRSVFEKDKALARRFQKVDVVEPGVQQTISILKGLKPTLEQYHGVRFSHAALVAASEMASRYLTDRFMPDKAIDVLDEAGAYQNLQPKSKRKKCIGVTDIEREVAHVARVPSRTVSASDKTLLETLERDLKFVIFGQDEAIHTLTDSIKLSRAGLEEVEKPVGSFLFAGSTGVGKTELAKQLAQLLGIALVRFDLSEYREAHTVSRLVGAPPGYVGFEQGGLLTDVISKTPHCVLLLDEFEKAHSDVFNLLLQVMDHGTLTDHNGRKTDFKHVILIMTTNAGAAETTRASMGFKAQDHSTDGLCVIQKQFLPEFCNRLDAIVQFNSLSKEAVVLIVEKALAKLQAQLKEKKVQLNVDAAAKQWLADHGFDPAMGARPMARLVKDQLKKPLVDCLLFGGLSHRGGCVQVTVDNGSLHLRITENPKSSIKKKSKVNANGRSWLDCKRFLVDRECETVKKERAVV